VPRGARSTTAATALVNSGRAGRCPSRGMGVIRSQASTSAGVKAYEESQENAIPIPPMSPNWLKPRKSVAISDA